MKKGTRQDGPAFTMDEHDRFHGILCSRPVCFDDKSKSEIILTFFIISRADGAFTICNVNRTYDSKGKCVTRSVLGKEGIPADRIDEEVRALRDTFARGIEAGSGRKLEWDWLDLSGATTTKEQIRMIREWGRVRVSLAADLPSIGLN